MSRDKKKNSGLFVACWFLFLILLLILFFVKKDNITSNLQKTDFFGKVFGTTPEFVKNHKTENATSNKDEVFEFDLLSSDTNSAKSVGSNKYEEATGSESIKKEKEELVANKKESVNEDKVVDLLEKESQPEDSILDKVKENKVSTPVVVSPKTSDISLYFIVIGSDGSISRKLVKRSMRKSDSPLTDAINTLLKGPLPSESSKNCMSLIPSGSRLLGASVKEGVATLNFSEEFEFNSVGVEGYIGQLMQIVYTATEFSTVKSVQFLIDGEKKDYLGSEGQWIGSPLARSSF